MGVARPNLHLGAITVEGEQAKRLEILRLVRELKHFRELAAERLVLRPAREALRRRVDEPDAPALVGRDDCVADASERRREPALALAQAHLRAVLVERHLDGRPQLALLEGLEQVAQRLGHLRAPKRAVVGVGRQVYDGRAGRFAYAPRGLHAVHPATQHDVH